MRAFMKYQRYFHTGLPRPSNIKVFDDCLPVPSLGFRLGSVPTHQQLVIRLVFRALCIHMYLGKLLSSCCWVGARSKVEGFYSTAEEPHKDLNNRWGLGFRVLHSDGMTEFIGYSPP